MFFSLFFAREGRQRLAAAVLALAASLALAPAASAEDRPPQELTVMLDWFVNPDHAPLIVAQEKGYYSEVGLDVSLVPPADPNDPPKLVAAGKADIAISYQPSLQMHVAEGLPLLRIGTLVATPLNTLVVLEDGPIQDLSSLAGSKIGYSVGGFEEALLGAMLESVGLRSEDVTLVNVNFSLSPALLSGQVDAVIGAFRNFELTQLALEGRQGKAFHVEEHGVPAYDELVLVAHKERRQDQHLRRFLAALEKGVSYLINHPEESWNLFIAAHPDLDDKLNRQAWQDTLPRFALRPAALDGARYERFGHFLQNQQLIDTLPPLESYAANITQP